MLKLNVVGQEASYNNLMLRTAKHVPWPTIPGKLEERQPRTGHTNTGQLDKRLPSTCPRHQYDGQMCHENLRKME